MPKGQKYGGRTVGTPNKATAEIKELAQDYGPEALETLAVIMRDSDSDAARVSAARELLDRAYGKASQHIKNDVNVHEQRLSERLNDIQQRLLKEQDAAYIAANTQSATSPPPV